MSNLKTRTPNRNTGLEDLIGGEITDALEDGWIEITLPDGQVVELHPDYTVVKPNQFTTETVTVGAFRVVPQDDE